MQDIVDCMSDKRDIRTSVILRYEDREAIAVLRKKYGLVSDADALRFALAVVSVADVSLKIPKGAVIPQNLVRKPKP